MASFHHTIKSGKKGSAANHATYITRQGKYSQRDDLVCAGCGNMPMWAQDNPSAFWRAGDKHERANGAVYREHEIALPDELTRLQQEKLVEDLVESLVGDKPYQFAVHAPKSALEGRPNTHLHLMFSDRMHDGIERSPQQTFSRYNAQNPEQGGCRKDSGGKNRLALRDEVIEIRRKCAEIQNAALEKHGHATRVDHRTLKQQGIGRPPERHLGPTRISNMSSEDKAQYIAHRAS
ncbi:MobA/MobL family protein [Paraburkholderia graminis]|uniref:MobA/MobL protein domain-containing protein n=1 Tax=Paraburkholderia graminis TaxID=60548 RepID=A0ABD5CC86_9BURK|nr:MobA/MobL family protein [Paraburkholderia graminis]MDR6202501.1 hypothetical protein [Paraburkholderia graminis]